jgi:hypothetical protein
VRFGDEADDVAELDAACVLSAVVDHGAGTPVVWGEIRAGPEGRFGGREVRPERECLAF